MSSTNTTIMPLFFGNRFDPTAPASVKRMERVACPNCGKKRRIQLWSVMCSTDSGKIDKLEIQRDINVFHCGKCYFSSFLEEPFLYVDLTLRFSVYFPTRALFDQGDRPAAVSKDGIIHVPPSLFKGSSRAIPAYIRYPHLVFSLGELYRYVDFRERCATDGYPPNTDMGTMWWPNFIRSTNAVLTGNKPIVISPVLREARRFLSTEQLIAFFREAGKDSRISAVRYVHERLDKGLTLDDIFNAYEEWTEQDELLFSGLRPHIRIDVIHLTGNKFSIEFGIGGGDAGDGGAWVVEFDDEGRLKALEKTDFWIA